MSSRDVLRIERQVIPLERTFVLLRECVIILHAAERP
jgi:hypothetical protein